MSGSAAGALLGLLAGLGLVYAAARTPLLRRLRLEDRLGPYLRDQPQPSRLLAERRPASAFAGVELLARPFLTDLARSLDRVLGGAAGLRRRLVQAGGRTTLEEFRVQQVVCAGVGALVGLVLLAVREATGSGPSALVLLALTVAGVAGGVVARDSALARAVRRRNEAIVAEFPTVAELLALAVTAGEGPVGALERVTRLCRGELGRELSLALADARAGSTLVQALEGIAARTTVAPLSRFVDGMAVAIERGTPLADVLRAQAVDVRESGKRALLEAGGRKEIAMMVPVKLSLGGTSRTWPRAEVAYHLHKILDRYVRSEVPDLHRLVRRPVALDEALSYLRAGDTLVVTKLDRLGRSVRNLNRSLTTCRPVRWRCWRCRRGSTPPRPGGRLFFHMLAAIAEFSDLIVERTVDGLAAARARPQRRTEVQDDPDAGGGGRATDDAGQHMVA